MRRQTFLSGWVCGFLQLQLAHHPGLFLQFNAQVFAFLGEPFDQLANFHFFRRRRLNDDFFVFELGFLAAATVSSASFSRVSRSMILARKSASAFLNMLAFDLNQLRRAGSVGF